jgi:hypothetical protein
LSTAALFGLQHPHLAAKAKIALSHVIFEGTLSKGPIIRVIGGWTAFVQGYRQTAYVPDVLFEDTVADKHAAD